MPNTHIFSPLFKQFKRLAATLVERKKAEIEEYTLEHFLLYHGLVGSSPDNQPEFRRVRADILEAFDNKSSINLSIALKLPPLWWQEKLQSVFAELYEKDPKRIVDMLIPKSEDGTILDESLLFNAEWYIRANAASILAFLGVKEAAQHIIDSLEQCKNNSLKPAFCHLTNALGKLGIEQCRQALVGYLNDEEPWFVVDASAALALFPLDKVENDLAKAMLTKQDLSDYMAVAIARQHPAFKLLNNKNSIVSEAALEMIIAICNKATQTYSVKIVAETGVDRCWPYLFDTCQQNQNPRLVAAALALSNWFKPLLNNDPDHVLLDDMGRTDFGLYAKELNTQIDACSQLFTKERLSTSLLAKLQKLDQNVLDPLNDTRHVIALVGQLNLTEAVPILINALSVKSPFLDEIIESLGQINNDGAAEQLIALAQKIIDTNERISGKPSAHPVLENDQNAAKTYWLILKALGNISSKRSVEFLTKATEDFAPDKRQQALESLVRIQLNNPNLVPNQVLDELIMRGFNDRCLDMRLAALDGASKLNRIELLQPTLKLIDAKEMSVSRKAIEAISNLAKGKCKESVVQAVEAKAKGEFNQYKKERLEKLLQYVYNEKQN